MSKPNWFKAHKYHLIIGVLLLIIVAYAFSPSEEPAITYKAPTSAEQKTDGAPKPKFQAIELSGQGSKITDPFELNEGGYKVTSHYVGESNFTVYIIKADGEEGPLLANEIGNADVSDSFKANGGQYRFKVGGDGAWTIKIEAL